MSAPDRATVLAAYRRALDIIEADPSLPVPYFAQDRGIEFFLAREDAPVTLAALEAAFGLADGIDPASARDRWVSSGDLGGVPVTAYAPAALVADRKVIGTKTVDDVGWVRKPVNSDEGDHE